MLIREDLAAALHRWREGIAAGVLALGGLWLIWLGGYLLVPLGLVVLGLAGLWGVQAWRRLRFAQAVGAPGVVEVDEAQVGYFGPGFGGFVALPDMVELRLLTLNRQRMWRLKQEDGQALLVPVSATGADRLFDAFASLPGMDTQALVAAASGAAGDGVVWRRQGHAVPNLRLVGN